MTCQFYVGQKIICIDASPLGYKGINGSLDGFTEGAVYTISRFRIASEVEFRTGAVLVCLVELPRPGVDGFYYKRFRPLINTDISVFKQMLFAGRPARHRRAAEIA